MAEDEDPYAPVGARDLIVLQLLARGYTAAQVSVLCNRTTDEVEAAVTRAARKLQVHGAANAIAEALRRGLIV